MSWSKNFSRLPRAPNPIGQGKDNAREFLRQNSDIALEIENKLREKFGVNARPAGEAQAVAEQD